MKYPKIPLAQTLVQLCKAKNIQHIVISPGSRNAPLTIGFTEDPFFTCYSIVDERSAGFFALGLAQQLQSPVVLVCTSGSAVLNYYPAVAEAFYSDIPLVVISADRPPYAIDIGDGQTIRQANVLEKHVEYSANLKQDIRKDGLKIMGDGKNLPKLEAQINPVVLQAGIQQFNEKEINQALNICIEKNGPVHINAPFEEPLYEVVEELLVFVKNEPVKQPQTGLNENELRYFIDVWNRCSQKMVLVGTAFPGILEEGVIDRLGNDNAVIVFTETTSNLHHENFFPGIDKIIAPIEKSDRADELFNQLRPELLITTGGMVVSKKIKAFLRKYQPKHHWHIDEKKAYDTYFCLERHIKIKPQEFFSRLLKQSKPVESNYQKHWLAVKNSTELAHENYVSQVPFSDFKVFYHLLKTIPKGYMLQLGNSSTVRYSQLFNVGSSLKVFCNRGTSGIEGSTSTAVGASLPIKASTVLITGDLSFLYDVNGLWNSYTRNDFRIIVINNRGGGIFRILPGDKYDKNFSTYLETTHSLSVEKLAEMYGYNYEKANTEKELIVALNSFYQTSEAPKILEIFTPRLLNDEILLDYFTFLKENR